jgi:hypothetical protein
MFPGKGLTICVSVIRGDYTRSVGEALAAKQSLRRTMDEERVKGFVDVLVARNVIDGLSHLYVYPVYLLSKEMLLYTPNPIIISTKILNVTLYRIIQNVAHR